MNLKKVDTTWVSGGDFTVYDTTLKKKKKKNNKLNG